jgi:hypothetical protein
MLFIFYEDGGNMADFKALKDAIELVKASAGKEVKEVLEEVGKKVDVLVDKVNAQQVIIANLTDKLEESENLKNEIVELQGKADQFDELQAKYDELVSIDYSGEIADLVAASSEIDKLSDEVSKFGDPALLVPGVEAPVGTAPIEAPVEEVIEKAPSEVVAEVPAEEVVAEPPVI